MIVPLGAWAFSILVMTEFMRDVPLELEEAARLDGAGDLRIFWSVVLPLCRPALGVIGIFGFTMIWDQYMLPLLVAQDASQFTLALALRSLRADEQVGTGVLIASALLALLRPSSPSSRCNASSCAGSRLERSKGERTEPTRGGKQKWNFTEPTRGGKQKWNFA
jgi:hypothetical protein